MKGSKSTWAILHVMAWPSLLHAWAQGWQTITQVRKAKKYAEIPLKDDILDLENGW